MSLIVTIYHGEVKNFSVHEYGQADTCYELLPIIQRYYQLDGGVGNRYYPKYIPRIILLALRQHLTPSLLSYV